MRILRSAACREKGYQGSLKGLPFFRGSVLGAVRIYKEGFCKNLFFRRSFLGAFGALGFRGLGFRVPGGLLF